MKLSIAPFLSLAGSNSVPLQQRNDLRFRFQFFRVQPLPDPLSVNDWITVGPAMSRVKALAVIESLVVIVMAFRTGVQRRIHGLIIATSMFGVARGAGNSGLAMRGNDTRSEAFGLVTGGAVGVHLFFVCHPRAQGMTSSARTAGRLFGNRRCQSEAPR